MSPVAAHHEGTSLGRANPQSPLPVEDASCIFCEGESARTIARGRDYEYESTPETFDLLQCEGCGLVFIQPRPAAAAMDVIYPENYYAYREGESESPFVKRFRDRIEQRKLRRYLRWVSHAGAEVLDVGCGDGRLLDVMRRLGPAGWRHAGIEIAGAAATTAEKRGFEVRSGDFESLVLDDWRARFDLALMHHVLEHTRDPRGAIRKVAVLLKGGGLLSVETPNLAGWDFHLFRKRYWGGYHIPRHFYLFDVRTLPRLLEEEGFDVVSVRSILSPAFWIFSWHNWLVDRSWGRRLAGACDPQNLPVVSAATLLELLRATLGLPSSNLQVLAIRR